MPGNPKPVLIIGGAGFVGPHVVRALRRLQPTVPILIGGRNLARAEVVARDFGARAVKVDATQPGLGLDDDVEVSAVLVMLKDPTLNSLRFAQDRGAPYISISSGLFEMAPEVAGYIARPEASAVVLASQWLVGAATLPSLAFGRSYQELDSIHISALLDEEDMGGPAASADYERIVGAGPAAMVRRDGLFTWLLGDEKRATIVSVDGHALEGEAYSPNDVVSLATQTGARDIRIDLAVGVSASRRRGEAFSNELVIHLAGRDGDGARRRSRHVIVHPGGQAPVTALGIASIIERALGLDGGPAPGPGLYFPESLLAPDLYVQRLKAFGADVVSQDLEAGS